MKRKLSLIGAILIILISICTYNYAAIEIVPSKNKGQDALCNTTISNSYLLCQGMTGQGESLQGATVKPHLATNKDWGAVSYLANSMYGTNTEGKNNGVTVSINGINYYSTTGNETGVMNWGSNPNAEKYTQTAGIINTYDNMNSTAKDNVTEIYNNRNSSFVDIVKTDDFTAQNTLGMAMGETRGIYSSWAYASTYKDYPISIRSGLFGFSVGSYGYYNSLTSGLADSRVTFRPVIWN